MTYVRERYNARTPNVVGAPGWAAAFLAWLRQEFLAIQRAMPWAPTADSRDFVSVAEGADVSAQFSTAAKSVGAGTLLVAPRIYRFATNTTIPAACLLKLERGALLRPQTGVTLTISGPMTAGLYQIFDKSGGGSFSFTQQKRFQIEWFGVVGDGSTDDTAQLNFLSTTVPNYASVYADQALSLTLTGEWLTSARQGVKIKARVPAFPDGSGVSLTWYGPTPIYGTDASTTSGSGTINFTHALTRIPSAGERFLIFATGGNGVNGLVASATSTSVTLAGGVTAPATLSGLSYQIGGVMVSLLSSDHCELEGFCVRPHPLTANVAQGFSAYIAAGSKTLNLAGTRGAFTLLTAGTAIRVIGAGPSGTDLVTTIASIGSATQCTLADAAATTISSSQLTDYYAGPSATSLPALIGILLDQTAVNGITGTSCRVRKNLFESSLNYPWRAICLSPTSQSNHELHHVEENTLHGGDFGLQINQFGVNTTASSTTINNPVANQITTDMIGMRFRLGGAGQLALTNVTMNATSTEVAVGGGLTPFLPSMVGQTIVINGAGPAGAALTTTVQSYTSPGQIFTVAAASTTVTGGTGTVNGVMLDTRITGITDNQHFVVATAPAVTVSNKTPNVGQWYGQGINVGPSANAKSQRIQDNIISNWLYGIRQENGSIYSRTNQFESCEACFRFEGSSEASMSVQDNHETSLRFIDNDASNLPVTFIASRVGSINMITQGGHIRCGVNAYKLRLIGCGFDNQPTNAEAFFFEGSSSNTDLVIEDCEFPAGTTMAMLINLTYLLSVSGRAEGRGNLKVTDQPARHWYYCGSSETGQYFGPNAKSVLEGGLTVGPATNTLLTNVMAYTPTLTPASVAANTIAEQTFAVTGLKMSDKVIVNPPAIANSTGIAGARVSATDTLAIRFVNSTSGALTPSSGTYSVLAFRN